MKYSKFHLITIFVICFIFIMGNFVLADDKFLDSNIPESWYHAPQLASEVGVNEFQQSPILDIQVENGELPSVETRLPEDPGVISPYDKIGKYGGTVILWDTAFERPAGWEGHYWQSIYAARTTPDAKEVVPSLIKDWSYSNDYKNLTLYLREDYKWSDGHPFTADDYIFAWEHYANNETLMPGSPENWDPPLLDVTKEGKYVVTFHYGESVPNRHYQLGFGVSPSEIGLGPKHYMKQFHPAFVGEEKANELAQEIGLENWDDLYLRVQDDSVSHPEYKYKRPVLQPYIATKRSETFLELTRNPYYGFVDPEGNQLPYIDTIRVNKANSKEMASTKAATGESTFAALTVQVESIPLYKTNAEKEDYNVYIWNNPRGSEPLIRLNLTHDDLELREIFQDVRFRRALSLSINREEINQKVFFGQALPMQANVYSITGFDEDFYEELRTSYAAYDPDRANELLDEMGLVDENNDGYRERPNGESLNLTVIYNTPPAFRTPVLELCRDYWEEIGINVNIKEVSFALLMEQWPANQTDISIWGLSWAIGFGPKTGRIWNSSYAPMSGWAAPAPWPGWCSWYNTQGEEGVEPPAEMKKLHEQAITVMRSPDEEKRRAALKQLLESQSENLWTIGTVGMTPQPIIAKKNLKNVPHKAYFGSITEFSYAHHYEQFYLDE